MAFTNIDEYIAMFDGKTKERLNQLRQIIKANVPPETTEKISWQMPTFYLNGNLVHFAAHKNHIGFYPGADGIANFSNEFGNLKFSKGAVQFPNKEPLPIELVKKIVQFRVAQNTGGKL